MSKFIYTTALSKIRKLQKRIKVIPGGTSSSKTYSILPILADKAIKTPGISISVVSESVPHLRRGAIKDFLNILKALGRYKDESWNRTMLNYTFSNGSYIEFFSADTEARVRGPRRNILFLNEANNVNFDAYFQLAIRTSDDIYLDFNPSSEFWAYTELKDDVDAEWLTLTYKDNEALSPSIIKEIEKAKEKGKTSSYWENWYKVYGLGQLGSLEGVIFSNWRQIDSLPADAKWIGTGLDFGYTNDPTGIVNVYEWNDKRILDEVCYQTGLVNSDIANKIKGSPIVYADSAEPKSIEEIKRQGVLIKGVTKGKDSINFGIQIMQSQEYLVTSRSINLIKELRAYCWDNDKTGNRINKPIDSFNHCIDAVRYHEMETLGIKKEIFFF